MGVNTVVRRARALVALADKEDDRVKVENAVKEVALPTQGDVFQDLERCLHMVAKEETEARKGVVVAERVYGQAINGYRDLIVWREAYMPPADRFDQLMMPQDHKLSIQRGYAVLLETTRLAAALCLNLPRLHSRSYKIDAEGLWAIEKHLLPKAAYAVGEAVATILRFGDTSRSASEARRARRYLLFLTMVLHGEYP